MRVAFAVFIFIHAAAHLVGFVTLSGIAAVEDVSGEPTLLLRGLDEGHWVFKLAAALWLVVLAGFVAAGIGVLQETSWVVPVLVASTALSTLLCLVWAKDTPFGLVANALIVTVLLVPAASERVLPETVETLRRSLAFH